MFRSLADQYSYPSDMPSLSVSARHGSVPIDCSRLFASRSSSSGQTELPPPGEPSPSPRPVTTGDRRRGVNLENWPDSTRSFSRVGRCLLFATVSRRATDAGTRTTSLVVLARRGLANAVRPLLLRKITVLPLRRALKCEPRIVSRLPTLTRIGVTRLMVGLGPVAAPATGGTARRAAAASVMQMMLMRRIALSLSVCGLVI